MGGTGFPMHDSGHLAATVMPVAGVLDAMMNPAKAEDPTWTSSYSVTWYPSDSWVICQYEDFRKIKQKLKMMEMKLCYHNQYYSFIKNEKERNFKS